MAKKGSMAEMSAESMLGVALGGDVDVDAMIQGVDASSLVPEGAGEEPAPEPEPQAAAPEPEPETEPEAEQESEPEPDAAQGEEPAWFKDLPETARAEARRLHQTVEGQRRALKRRADAQAEAERERREAISIAVQLKRQMGGGVAPQDQQQPTPQRQAQDFLEAEVDDEGNIRIPVEKLRGVIEGYAKEQGSRVSQVQGEAAQKGQYANKILAEAGVSQATQERLMQAIQYSAQRLKQVVEETGRVPRNVLEERQLLENAGVGAEVAEKFGGVRIVDVYDVYESAREPFAYGHRLVDITKRYEAQWNGNGKPAPKQNSAPRKIGEHPAPMSRKGFGGGQGVQPNGSAVDDIERMSMDELLQVTNDPKRVGELLSKWDKEVAGR